MYICEYTHILSGGMHVVWVSICSMTSVWLWFDCERTHVFPGHALGDRQMGVCVQCMCLEEKLLFIFQLV